MSDSKSDIKPSGKPRYEIDPRLSTFANVAASADHTMGRIVRFQEGMTVKDAVIITGLPEEEVIRRIREMKRDRNPKLYALTHLAQGAGEKYRAEQAAAALVPKPPEPPKVVQLAFWGEDYRAAPNAVFRSALFPALCAQDKENRRYLKNEEIFCVAGLKILFTGEQFDQSDLDVYLELLKMARAYPLGTPVNFSAHALLKALNLHTGGKEHARLHSVLIRLCAGVSDITDHGVRYFGQLLHGGVRDELSMSYTIRINPEFAALFGYGMYTKLDLEQHRALGRNNTAKALHAYYSSHISPGFHNFETLARLVGLSNSNPRQIKATLLKAHEAMKAVGFLNGYEIRGDSIKPDINHSPSQNRALLKKTVQEPEQSTVRETGQGLTAIGDILPRLPSSRDK